MTVVTAFEVERDVGAGNASLPPPSSAQKSQKIRQTRLSSAARSRAPPKIWSDRGHQIRPSGLVATAAYLFEIGTVPIISCTFVIAQNVVCFLRTLNFSLATLSSGFLSG